MKFVFDLDGTLCFDCKMISDSITQAIQSVEEKGHQIYFASARPIRDMLPVLPKVLHHHSMVGSNGSLIKNQGADIQFTASLPSDILPSLLEFLRKIPADYVADSDWNYSSTLPKNHYLYPHVDPLKVATNLSISHLDRIAKILLFPKNNFSKLLHFVSSLPASIVCHNGEEAIDINPLGITKWEGLKALGIQDQEAVIFGNDLNDIPMFQKAKEAICIGNHKIVSTYATDTIYLTNNYEEKISKKILSYL